MTLIARLWLVLYNDVGGSYISMIENQIRTIHAYLLTRTLQRAKPFTSSRLKVVLQYVLIIDATEVTHFPLSHFSANIHNS
jgi:hypothetical protein